MTKLALLSGNEAIARGAFEAGVKVASAYPGTPSTEILENMGQYERIHSQWSPNEKVALEVAIGASIAGARALAAMKHVGVNVAADPLLTFSYTGVNGGMVLVSADDPEMHSSQNEQDNRYFGMLAKIPVIEPSDSQEAKDFVKEAMLLSEAFDTPVILRTTTRVNHSKSLVTLDEPQEMVVRAYERNPAKYVMTPGNAKGRHVAVEERRLALTEYAQDCSFNRMEMGDRKIGFITSGISYQYLKEIYPEASFLKLGLLWPLNESFIKSFAEKVERLIVVEELEPILEMQIKGMGIAVEGKNIIPRRGELSEEILREVLQMPLKESQVHQGQPLPVRPPILCPGCSHRGMFYTLKKMGVHVSGDIGCYALGSAPPFSCLDTTICMGASISGSFGMELARGEDFAKRLVSVIGDSTFFHSGITGLIDMVYNQGRSTVLILDNAITAMTGHQDNPGTGKDLYGMPAPQISIEKLVESIGIKDIHILDPFDLKETEAVVSKALETEEVSVIIARRPCALHVRLNEPSYWVDQLTCIGCKMCLDLGCPAISVKDFKSSIDPLVCVGCGLCPKVCPTHSIKEAGEKHAK